MEEGDIVMSAISTNISEVKEEDVHANDMVEEFCSPSKFAASHYRHFFNIDLDDFLQRTLIGINPIDKRFFSTVLQADLFGPIWIPTIIVTLSMLIGSVYNIQHFNFLGYFLNLLFTYTFIFVTPIIYHSILKLVGAPSVVHIQSMFGYSFSMHFISLILTSIVGINAQILFAVITGTLFGIAFFYKIQAAFDDVQESVKALIPNIVVSVLFALEFVLIILFSKA